MSYAQLFAQKLNNESNSGQRGTDNGRTDRRKDEDRKHDNRTDRKRERHDSRSEPDRKRPYDGPSRPNSRARQKKSSRYHGRIPDNWIDCPDHGELIHDFILPIKVPLHPNYDNVVKKRGNLWKMKDLFQLEEKFNKKIGIVIDLTNTRRYYCIESITQKRNSSDHKRIHLKQAIDLHTNYPPQEVLDRLFDALDKFRRESPGEMAIVHCTHGFNRTGLLIVSYLTERLDMPVSEALKLFSMKRNGGIYKDYIVEAIFEKYKTENEECPTVTVPSWVDKKKLDRKKD